MQKQEEEMALKCRIKERNQTHLDKWNGWHLKSAGRTKKEQKKVQFLEVFNLKKRNATI